MIALDTLRRLNQSTGYLLYLGFAPPARLCSYGTVDALGQTWPEGEFTVGGLEEGEHGIESIEITLGDPQFSWCWRLRQEWRPGLPCHWHLLYRGATGWETERVFSGELERPRLGTRGSVILEARVASADTAVVPRVPFESQHSLARGAEVVINGTTYRVE